MAEGQRMTAAQEAVEKFVQFVCRGDGQLWERRSQAAKA
jgi:ABC-type Fe3+ transport system substrate-binding protein